MKRTLLAVMAWFCLVLSLQAQTQILAPMPPHLNPFTGNVRGYYFVAPSCFTITGLQLPSEAGGGAQSIAVLRFPATPPAFSATTNTFETLFLTQNNPNTGILPTNIQVEQGDIIGVLGQAGTTNSYGNGTLGTTIEGFAVPLYRLGMQFTLTTTPPQQIWTETGSTNISRVNLYYDSLLTFTANNALISGNTYGFSTNADTSFSVAWNFGDGSPLDTADAPTHTYTSSGVFNACAYVTTTCGTDTVCTTVSICAPAIAGFGASSVGMDAFFSDSTSSGDTVTWDFGDGNFGAGFNATHTYAVPDTYMVCQYVTNYCSADTLCQTIVVCAPPVADYVVLYNQFGMLSFADTSQYATSWFWDFGDGNTDTIPDPFHTYSVTGTYNVCLIASNFCGADTFCTVMNSCTTEPWPFFSHVENLLVASFFDGSGNATSYFWDFGDGSTDTTASPVHTYATAGTYVVCMTASNICNDDSTVCDTITVVAVGINEAMPGYTVQVSPNPMSETAQVMVVTEGIEKNFTFTLMDLTGRKLTSMEGAMGESLTIDRSAWASGIYLYQVVSEGNVLATGRLVVE